MTKDFVNFLKIAITVISLLHSFALSYVSNGNDQYSVASIVFFCTALICISSLHPKDETASLRDQIKEMGEIIKELKKKV